jgi:hypothetical protein
VDSNIVFALIPITALSIPIVAILSKPLRRWLDLKERQLELTAQANSAAAAEHAAKIERLEAHVAVLNRIATDRATGLAHEIDQLRGPAAPLN